VAQSPKDSMESNLSGTTNTQHRMVWFRRWHPWSLVDLLILTTSSIICLLKQQHYYYLFVLYRTTTAVEAFCPHIPFTMLKKPLSFFPSHSFNAERLQEPLDLALPALSDSDSILERDNEPFDQAALAAANKFVKNTLQSKQPKMIVFDKDGTLGDCTGSLRRWIHHMRDKIILHVDSNISKDDINTILVDFYQRMGWDGDQDDVLPSAPVAAGTWDDILGLMHQFLNAHADELPTITVSMELAKEWNAELGIVHGSDAPLIDDLAGMMMACKNYGYSVAICTSDDRQGTTAAMEAWQITNVVDISICGNEVQQGKPSAVPIQRLCELANQRQLGGFNDYSPENCIVVGDTTADTGMAKAADVGFCVGVLTGSGTAKQLRETGAHLILPSVGSILALLETLDCMSLQDRLEPSQ